VICPFSHLDDWLATAMFFVNIEKLQPFFEISIVRVFFESIDAYENFKESKFTKQYIN